MSLRFLDNGGRLFAYPIYRFTRRPNLPRTAIARSHGQVGSAIAGLRDRRYVGYAHLPSLRITPIFMETYKIGLSGVLGKLTLDDTYLELKSLMGAVLFRVAVSEVKTVSVVKSTFTKSFVKIMGAGSELGTAELPTAYAYKVQDWISSRIK